MQPYGGEFFHLGIVFVLIFFGNYLRIVEVGVDIPYGQAYFGGVFAFFHHLAFVIEINAGGKIEVALESYRNVRSEIDISQSFGQIHSRKSNYADEGGFGDGYSETAVVEHNVKVSRYIRVRQSRGIETGTRSVFGGRSVGGGIGRNSYKFIDSVAESRDKRGVENFHNPVYDSGHVTQNDVAYAEY